MEHLKQSDLRTLLSFLRDCYAIREFESFEQFLRNLVTSLAQLVPANAVFYIEVTRDSSSSRQIGTQSYIENPEAMALWGQHLREHPAYLQTLRTGDTSARSISQFWSRRQFHDTALYSSLYRPYDVQDDLALLISFDAPHIVLGWHDDRCFTGRERLLADLAGPHLKQAWQNGRLVSEIFQAQHLKHGVEGAAAGVIFCDGGGRVRFNTSLARRYLVEYFGRVSQNLNDSLPDELLRWMCYQNAQLLKNDVPSARLPLSIQKGHKRLTIRLLSSPGANLLFMEEETPPPSADMLHPLGLSRRESEVLSWVAQGKTNGEIASILGMNVGTVKKHLVNIFQKLGVETRTAAAALALQAHSSADNRNQ